MDQVAIALLGVVAGALASGMVQTVTGWLARRSDSLAAARLVFGQIVDAELTLEASSEAQRFQLRGGAQRLFVGHIATWEAQRQALARVLNVVDFNMIQAAFASLKHIEDVIAEASRKQRPDGGWSDIRRDPYYQARIDTLAEARKIATGASLRVRERLRLGKHQARLEAVASGTLPRSDGGGVDPNVDPVAADCSNP